MVVIGWNPLPRPAALGPLTEPRYLHLDTHDARLYAGQGALHGGAGVLAIVAGYAVVMSITNYSAIGV